MTGNSTLSGVSGKNQDGGNIGEKEMTENDGSGREERKDEAGENETPILKIQV